MGERNELQKACPEVIKAIRTKVHKTLWLSSILGDDFGEIEPTKYDFIISVRIAWRGGKVQGPKCCVVNTTTVP